MSTMRAALACAFALAAIATQASASPTKAAGTPAKAIVKFDGDTIDGDLLRPDGDLMAVRPELNMPGLVHAPKSFETARRQTILSAADAIAGRRGQNINMVRR